MEPPSTSCCSVGEASTPSTSPCTQSMEVEQQQEAILAAKYGGILPKKHLLARRHSNNKKHFDSADWAMKIEGAPSEDLPAEGERLPAVLQPAVLQAPQTPLVSRRSSNLGA